MIRELIISCIIHLMVVAFVMRMPKTPPLQIGRVGERIEVRMTSAKAGAPSEAKKGSASEDQKKKVEPKPEKKKEEKKEEKKLPEKKVIEKKHERKPVEKPKKKAEKIEEPKEKIEDKSEVVEAPEVVEETIKDTSEESGADKPTVADESKEAVEGTGAEDLTAGAIDGSEQLDEGLVRLSDGSLSAKHQGVKGLSYGFISNPVPAYPSVAKRLGFKGDMVVKVIMQFDSNGELKDFKFVGERDRFGFANEVEKTVRNWKLTPIRYKGQQVNMRFYKSFKFNMQNS